MTAAEHAMENAVFAIERATKMTAEPGMEKCATYDVLNKAYARWRDTDPNLEQLHATPDEIWNMAMWVVYNDRPNRGEE